jgi:hypothetical protein
MKKSLLLLFFVGSLCLLNACSGSGGSTPPVLTATHFSVTAPATATAGTAFNFTVTALDASNNIVTTYSGTVHFTSIDAHAVLPGSSTLMQGMGTFSATFNTSGNQTITATDTVKPTITGVSNETQVCCTAPPGAFTPTGSMQFARIGHTATLLQNGMVLVAGGENSTGALASAEIYDPATGMFTSTGSMGTARVGHTATLLANGNVLVAGGNVGAEILATAEIFDPATGMFTPTNGNMETARVGHTATLLNDGSGRVLVAGGGAIAPWDFFGFPGENDHGSASAELFDPNSGEFTPAGNNMLAKRIYHTATLLPNGDVLLAGGTNTTGGSALGDLFSPATAMFSATTTGGTTDLHLATVALQDGNVLLTGGEFIDESCVDSEFPEIDARAFLFNTSAASFSATGGMSNVRESHTATLLPRGEVLIAGGSFNAVCGEGLRDFERATAELFSPVSGTFTPTGSMETARAGHTATLLGNGQVLVVGGFGAGNTLNSAELFQ